MSQQFLSKIKIEHTLLSQENGKSYYRCVLHYNKKQYTRNLILGNNETFTLHSFLHQWYASARIYAKTRTPEKYAKDYATTLGQIPDTTLIISMYKQSERDFLALTRVFSPEEILALPKILVSKVKEVERKKLEKLTDPQVVTMPVLYKNKYFIVREGDYYRLSPHFHKMAIDWKHYSQAAGEEGLRVIDTHNRQLWISEENLTTIRLISHNHQHYLMCYHITTDTNLASITEKGLIPRIGPLAQALGEQEKHIYLFPNEDTMDDALMGWLGDAYEDYCDSHDMDADDLVLHSLQVLLPLKDIASYLVASEVGYECLCSVPIPRNFIYYHREQ